MQGRLRRRGLLLPCARAQRRRWWWPHERIKVGVERVRARRRERRLFLLCSTTARRRGGRGRGSWAGSVRRRRGGDEIVWPRVQLARTFWG